MASHPTRFHLGATSVLPAYLGEPGAGNTLNAILDPSSAGGSSTAWPGGLLHGLNPKLFTTIARALSFLPPLVDAICGPSADGENALRALGQRLVRQLSGPDLKVMRLRDSQPDPAEIERLTNNTKRALDLPTNASEDEIVAACAGQSQRWESIGIVLAISGTSLMCSTGPAAMGIAANGADVDGETTIRTLIEASHACETLVDTFGSVNELAAWHHLEHTALCRMYYGELHRFTWHRLGRLSSSVVENGLDRMGLEEADAPRTNTLDEVHREISLRSHELDKQLSVSTGRPPLIRNIGSLSQSCLDKLHQLGATILMPSSTDLLRVRGATVGVRQEILDLLLSCHEHSTGARRVDVLDEKLQTIWNSLPPSWRAQQDHWRADRPMEQTCRIVLIWLEHGMNKFLLDRLRLRSQQTAESAMTVTCKEIIDAVLSLALQRGRLRDVRVDYGYIVTFVGLPAARVLAYSLRYRDWASQQSSHGISQGELVRRLSSFSRCLQWAMPHKNGNFGYCCRSKRFIQDALSSALSSPVGDGRSEDHPAPGLLPWSDGIGPSMNLANIADPVTWSTANFWQGDWTIEAERSCKDQTTMP